MNKIFKIVLIFFLCISSYSKIAIANEDKIKIGLLVPITGDNKDIGKLIIKSTRMALQDINNDKIEIYPKDTASSPEQTLQSAIQLKDQGIKIVIGPIFYKSLIYLNDVQDLTFLSLTNKTEELPNNVISSGVNATSQLKTIKKFVELNEIQKPILLTPDLGFKSEIKKGIKESEIKILKHYIYDKKPTKLTAQIEKITNYKVRKQNLADEIKRVENSDLPDKEKQLKKLEKKYTIGNVNFDSVIISDFNESLKSVITSLLYTDVSPKQKSIITFNQWFDQSILNEKNIQPIYYPSINNENLKEFKNKFSDRFDENPSHLSLLSYDLVGLIYYLSINNDLKDFSKLFKKKNSFKGKIGIFDIQNNKINHRLNFYKIDNGKIKKIF
tara:strand:+ start:1116 stop:2270 length:1155 start_codon:yes stop_codon:yes gene_type:complete